MKAAAGSKASTAKATPKNADTPAEAKPAAKAAGKTAMPKPIATARKTEAPARAEAEAPMAAPRPAAKAPAPKAAAARTSSPAKIEAPAKAEAASKAPAEPPRATERPGAPTGMAEAQAPAPSMTAPAPEPIIQAPIRPAPPPKPLGNAGKDFKAGDFVVYPTHGVGQVQGIEEVPVAGQSLKVIVVTFEENRMTLKVPMAKAASSGLRKLASEKVMGEALDTLRGRARIKRTMWSRRAQEYEQKINSGDPIAIAEVVRDLHRNAGQPDQSFSERQIYELALDRLAAEVAALDRTDKNAATQKLLDHLKTSEKEK
ncbi:transcriptional regulator, CarD family [Roseomonas rosea]|uniref:Transcriptional regulator, CarD family n=2 Tax=Muricoccus roseus TaxID=198092 RepID=A0A1M6NK67_9PROT|nr:transcriptional regulator, CarD family [Roseomonas rosea]